MEIFFATCPRGLERLLAEDLADAGAQGVEPVAGGVQFRGDWRVCYRANLHSRIATRVLWRVAHGWCRSEDDIYRLAFDTPWERWFQAEQTLRVDVGALKSPLKSIDFITLRIKDAVCDRFRRDSGRRPSVDTRQPDVRVYGFVQGEQCTLYLDTSGAPLFQRGFRQKTVAAPLKENLAAGLLRLSGWQPGSVLLDPMCGSGTVLVEAAQMARRIAPGSRRTFAFQRLRSYDPAAWAAILDAARAAELPAVDAPLFGSDLSPVAVRASLANLDRAGLLPDVRLQTADLLNIEAPAATGFMLANPPYGERVSHADDLAQLYPRLGTALKRRFAGWTCCFLSADTRLPQLMRLTPTRKTPLFNGALECRLYEFRMVAGSNRRPVTLSAEPAT